MLKMVDGTGIIGVDMICPLGVSAPQPPNYDRVELEGTGILVLPNSLNAPLERLELGGKTEQVQTSGKNLFDFSNLESGRINISTGALEEHNHTRRLADYIDITDITSFSFYLPGYNKANGAVYVIIYYYDKDKNYLSYKPCGDKIEKYENITPVENAVYIKVSLEQNTIDNPQNIFKVQLEKGAKSTAYEPYTGGKPSPTPEYPQEIKNVGKWNEETQKYEVDVKVTGKNLFDKDKVTNENPFGESYRYVPIYIGKGTKTVTVQYSKKLSEGLGFYTCISRVAGSSTQIFGWLYHSGASSLAHNLLQFQANQDTVYLSHAGDINALKNELCQYLQVEISDIQTPYQPYKEQTLTLTSDRPITKWDKLVEQDGQIGWLYKSAVVKNFNGDGYKIQSAGNIGNVNKYSIVFPDAPIKGNATADIYVDRYRGINVSYTKEEYGICCNWNDGIKYFNAPNETVKTVDDFKKWLTENPLTIAYETESTEFVPLPEEEQNAIRALKTYYPTTVITADGGELDPDIKVTYRKEI